MSSVVRLIHPTYFKEGLPQPVRAEAFRPTEQDSEGQSVFWADQATPEQALQAVPAEKRHLYFAVAVPVEELTALGLTVEDDPIDEAPGHAVIPGLSWLAYKADKVAGKALQQKLAAIASARIVHSPTITS